MQTIFLAAGKNSRVAPISDKNFLEFGGEKYFLKLLKNAKNGGCENFVIVANSENLAKIKKICGENLFLKTAKIAVQKNLRTGMAGAIAAALEFCDAKNEILILGGNDFFSSQIFAEIFKIGRKNDGAILAKKMEKYFPGGYLQFLRDEKKISKIVEKPRPENLPSNFVTIVAHFFARAEILQKKLAEKNFADFAKKSTENSPKIDDFYEQILDELFAEKFFAPVFYDDFWFAIKFPHHILEIAEFFLKNLRGKIAASAQISDRAILKNPEKIFISKNVKIFENATICGPVFLGENSVVGTGALVRDSIVGANCEIGFSSEIARSFLARNVRAHRAFLGDSVVDENVNFGAFSCTANLRFDEKKIFYKIKNQKICSDRQKFGAVVGKNSRVGIGAKIMPGAKIPPNFFVGPGEIFFGK